MSNEKAAISGREIKFRGKTISTGVFLIGDLVRVDGRCFILPHTPTEFISIALLPVTASRTEQFEVIPKSVGQFLNRKDCKGVDIYEGDIYEWEYHYDADYDGDMPIVKVSKGKDYVRDIYDNAEIRIAASEGPGVTVIGNITDSPGFQRTIG